MAIKHLGSERKTLYVIWSDIETFKSVVSIQLMKIENPIAQSFLISIPVGSHDHTFFSRYSRVLKWGLTTTEEWPCYSKLTQVTKFDWLTDKLLLVLASTLILGSESHGTHNHILPSDDPLSVHKFLPRWSSLPGISKDSIGNTASSRQVTMWRKKGKELVGMLWYFHPKLFLKAHRDYVENEVVFCVGLVTWGRSNYLILIWTQLFYAGWIQFTYPQSVSLISTLLSSLCKGLTTKMLCLFFSPSKLLV
jgi:hypothetical protein